MDKNLSKAVKILLPEQIVYLKCFLPGASFCFLKFNQQKRVAMVNGFYHKYTKNVLWTDLH